MNPLWRLFFQVLVDFLICAWQGKHPSVAAEGSRCFYHAPVDLDQATEWISSNWWKEENPHILSKSGQTLIFYEIAFACHRLTRSASCMCLSENIKSLLSLNFCCIYFCVYLACRWKGWYIWTESESEVEIMMIWDYKHIIWPWYLNFPLDKKNNTFWDGKVPLAMFLHCKSEDGTSSGEISFWSLQELNPEPLVPRNPAASSLTCASQTAIPVEHHH